MFSKAFSPLIYALSAGALAAAEATSANAINVFTMHKGVNAAWQGRRNAYKKGMKNQAHKNAKTPKKYRRAH